MSELRMPKTNIVVIAGRISREIELKYTPSGNAVTTIAIANDQSYKKNDEWQDKAVFIDVEIWNKTAEYVAEKFHKGSGIIIEGTLMSKSYTDKEGKNRKFVYVLAKRIEALEKQGETYQQKEHSNPPMSPTQDDDNPDVPF